jgi:hypothetical protein
MTRQRIQQRSGGIATGIRHHGWTGKHLIRRSPPSFPKTPSRRNCSYRVCLSGKAGARGVAFCVRDLDSAASASLGAQCEPTWPRGTICRPPNAPARSAPPSPPRRIARTVASEATRITPPVYCRCEIPERRRSTRSTVARGFDVSGANAHSLDPRSSAHGGQKLSLDLGHIPHAATELRDVQTRGRPDLIESPNY